jgi:uncharacterized protein (UPF0332 family)
MKADQDLINYRIQRSVESYEDALLLTTKSHWNSVVNRLYYAAYYSVSALLLTVDVYAKTYTGLKSKFHEHFIKTQRLSRNAGNIYDELFSYRQEGDYSDFITYTKEEIELLVLNADLLLKEIKTLLNQ